VKSFLEKEKLPHFEDPIGNIVVGAGSEKEYLNKLKNLESEPLRFFIAHMDHPGFHGVKWINQKTLEVKWHGGTPKKFLNGSKVWLSTQSGNVWEGKIQKAKLNKAKTALESSEVVIVNTKAEKLEGVQAKELFGAFLFSSPVWEKKKVIYTKAADDLVGVFTILTLAKHSKNRNSKFLGLISRAEEVGFVGTIAHLNLGWMEAFRSKVAVVSLETSRTLPGAVIGKGPVVRLGDRATPFDPGLTQVLTQVAQEKLKLKYQRRIMDGGTCEATAALAFGYRAMGISIPLGNYHNQSFEGGPESRGEWGPAPEFVHLEDIQGMLQLCEGLMEENLPWNDPWLKKREALLKSKEELSELLKLR
jgi:endoglucanase